MRALFVRLLQLVLLAGSLVVFFVVLAGRYTCTQYQTIALLDGSEWSELDASRAVAAWGPSSRSADSLVLLEERPGFPFLSHRAARRIFWKYDLKSRKREKIELPLELNKGYARHYLWNAPTLWLEAYLERKGYLFSKSKGSWQKHLLPFSADDLQLTPSKSGVWIVAAVYGKARGYSVYHFDGRSFQHYPFQQNLIEPSGWGPSILEDYQGGVWLVSKTGLLRHDGRQFVSVTSRGRPIPAVRAWATDEGNWFMTGTGLHWIGSDLAETAEVTYRELGQRNNGAPLFPIAPFARAVYTHGKAVLLSDAGGLYAFDGKDLRRLVDLDQTQRPEIYVTEDGRIVRAGRTALAQFIAGLKPLEYMVHAAVFLGMAAFAALKLAAFAFGRRSQTPRTAVVPRGRREVQTTYEADRQFLRALAAVISWTAAVPITLLVCSALGHYFLAQGDDSARAGMQLQLGYQLFAAAFFTTWLCVRAILPFVLKIIPDQRKARGGWQRNPPPEQRKSERFPRP